MADSFNTKTWESEETITASDLNRMEQGIESANDRVVVVRLADPNEFTYNKLFSYIASNKIVVLNEDTYTDSSFHASLSTVRCVRYDAYRQRYYALADSIAFNDDEPDNSTVLVSTYIASSPDEPMIEY